MINTRLGEMDETLLERRDDVFETDDIRLDAVEYCVKDCEGWAHTTGVAQGDGCFCELHVHRSVHGTIKRFPVEASGVTAALV